MKPGIKSADKMSRLINSCMQQTLKENKKRLDSLFELVGEIEYLAIDWGDEIHHVKQLTNYNSISELETIFQKCLKLASRHDSSLLIFFDLWRELGRSLRNLICGNYNCVFRSLRWMVETCIFWADMQLDNLTAQEYFDFYKSQSDKITDEEFKRVFHEIKSKNETRLEERLTFKEKYRQLRINEIINNLSILKNRNNKDVARHLIKDALLKIYSEFSEYSHITKKSLEELYMEPGEVHYDFAFYQGYCYNKDNFDFGIQNILHTIDLLLSVIILVETNFYDYKTSQDFLSSLKDSTNNVFNKIDELKDNMPFLNEMILKIYNT